MVRERMREEKAIGKKKERRVREKVGERDRQREREVSVGCWSALREEVALQAKCDTSQGLS